MATPVSVLSKTLTSISLTKIIEIEKQRSTYEERKDRVLKSAEVYPNEPRKRIQELYKGVLSLYPEAKEDDDVKNIKFWLLQSQYDASVPASMLESMEEELRSKLDEQSRKLNLAHLYSQLITEWMNPTKPVGNVSIADDEAFIVLDRQEERLQELCDKFERVVFHPLETSEVEIDLLLSSLFDSEEAQKGLGKLRRYMASHGNDLIEEKNPFDQIALKWCLNGLLAEDLLSEEKQAVLRDFLQNEIALNEIGDVLNMRYGSFEEWQWHAGEDGIPVLPRQQLNGKYRIWMDEDVLQAIFIEYVGIKSCNFVKALLKNFISDSDNAAWNWKSGSQMTRNDKLRRKYYTDDTMPTHKCVDLERQRRFTALFFMSQLPSTVDSLSAGTYVNDFAGDDKTGNAESGTIQVTNIKQELLRTLATECLIHRAMYGEVAVVQSDLQWYATGLSHTTIFAVMRFFGLPDRLISFFKKVLEAPLNMTPASEDAGPRGPKIRRRGVPMAHATEKFIGELVLFAMDLVVNKATGLLLYRLHDDLFLVGKPSQCAQAWKAMQSFAKVMGLEFNMHKTGSVYLTSDGKPQDPAIAAGLPKGPVGVGHLMLDPKSGDWIIDQKQVGEHVKQLGKQLASCDSILRWVQTWNSCIGRFFSHTFGQPAFCFGVKHLESILETYKQMQAVLFTDPEASDDGDDGDDDEEARETQPGNVVDYLKAKIHERFGVSDVPNSFILLPEQLGGLGVRNPFIPMLVLKENLEERHKTPDAWVKAWLEGEKEDYAREAKEFAELPSFEDRLWRLHKADAAGNYEKTKSNVLAAMREGELNTFYSFEEHTRWRETTSRHMLNAYVKLVSAATPNDPELDWDVKEALQSVGFVPWDASAKTAEAKWALQMYGGNLRGSYGGLRLIDEKFLPLGLLTMMRSKAVRWTMVL